MDEEDFDFDDDIPLTECWVCGEPVYSYAYRALKPHTYLCYSCKDHYE